MDIVKNFKLIKKTITDNVLIIAVSKTKSKDKILKIYNIGHRNFGENKIQELKEKYNQLPKDIKWHMIGHVQRNKVKYNRIFYYLLLCFLFQNLDLIEKKFFQQVSGCLSYIVYLRQDCYQVV